MGKTNPTIAVPTQQNNAPKLTPFSGRISGKYIHITGPIETPNPKQYINITYFANSVYS